MPDQTGRVGGVHAVAPIGEPAVRSSALQLQREAVKNIL
jgi:hypothetical protein